MCRAAAAAKQILGATKPFFALAQTSGNSRWLSIPQRGSAQLCTPGDSQMRSFSFILALAAFLIGPSLAGSSKASLPGVGTFSYNGSPVVSDAPQLTVVAAR
jgi:hypothetical protein